MENITLGQILTAGGVVTGILALISYLTKPVKEFSGRVDKLERNQDKDLKRLNRFEDDINQILLSIQVLLKHGIDSNHTGELKEREQELNKYILNRRD